MLAELYRRGRLLEGKSDEADYARGLRLGVLSNETVSAKGFLSSFPENVIGDAEVAHVLKTAEWAEAQAMILNPTISDEVLLALYNGDKTAEGIDEDRRRQLVVCSADASRLGTNTDDEFGPDMRHWQLHEAIFEMLATVPTSDLWAASLAHFLRRLDPSQVRSMGNIDEVLDRWVLDENGIEQDLGKKDDYTDTGLSRRQELRCLISALHGKSYKEGVVVHGSADDDDLVKRCAYYGNGRLEVKDIDTGFKRDNELFTFAAMYNDALFSDRKTRRFFEEECLCGRDIWLYQMRCQQIHRRRSSFDTRPSAEWMLDGEKEKVRYATEHQIAEVHASVKELQKFAMYASFMALAVLFLRRYGLL